MKIIKEKVAPKSTKSTKARKAIQKKAEKVIKEKVKKVKPSTKESIQKRGRFRVDKDIRMIYMKKVKDLAVLIIQTIVQNEEPGKEYNIHITLEALEEVLFSVLARLEGKMRGDGQMAAHTIIAKLTNIQEQLKKIGAKK